MIAPLRSSGGMRVMLPEALARGIPVVATSLACAGLDLTPGEHLLVADTPSAFADAVALLLRDPDLRLITLIAPGGMGKTRLASAVESSKSGIATTGIISWCQGISQISHPVALVAARRHPPTKAGTTLSGCPSRAIAIPITS